MCVCVCVLQVRNMEGSATVTTWCSLVTISTNRLLRSGFNNNNNNNNKFQLEDGGTRPLSNLRQRLALILKNKLGKSLAKGTKTYSVSVLAYHFGVMNWTPTALEKIPTPSTSLLTKYRFYRLTSVVERVTLPRKYGGRVIIDVSAQHCKPVFNLCNYIQERGPNF